MLARSGARGWAALCRLISAAHLGGERGRPLATLDLVAEHAAGGDLLVLLGPASEVGRAVAARRPDLARAALDRWRDGVDPGQLRVEVVSHHAAADPLADQRRADLGRALGSGGMPALSTALAGRMLGFAAEHGVAAVLANAVRHARPDDAVTADVLDAVRRLVPLDRRHLDRRGAQAWVKPGAQMAALAEAIARAAGASTRAGALSGSDRTTARRLLEATEAAAADCVLDPRADLGLGGIHVPEVSAIPSVAADRRAPDAILRARCEAGLGERGMPPSAAVRRRLDDELATIASLGYAPYFLCVADVVDLIRSMRVRVAARGSGAGSLVNYLTGVSGVDPIRHGLLMERFLSPLRQALPDVDVDVESARRTEVYEQILARYGGDRCACVSMADTYRVRHAIRDVGAALGLPPGEIDSLAKAFPHIRARDARAALRDLPELRQIGRSLGNGADADGRLDLLFSLVERLDGLPRHLALHPCGVLLSDATLLDRTPVEASWLGFPMSQFDKDDVEDLGLLKLDVLGIRMQSAMAHALDEVERVDGPAARPDLDALPLDDAPAFALIRSTRTLGCFQIESPGQRELLGKFAPETFGDLIVDISLFRPGPVKSDMVTPFLRARQGWEAPEYPHPDLRPALAETYGVVVFHEQVLRILAAMTGCSLAEADEHRRTLGSPDGQLLVREWFYPAALGRGYRLPVVERVWDVLRAFASFGFCKAHAAAFALPTYHSAYLKAHHPAAFLAGVLTHDPGMYPKRLILDDARQLGIAVLGLDVNRSDATYRIERVGPHDEPPPEILGEHPRRAPAEPGVPDGRAYGIRLSLADVKGIDGAEIARIIAGQPYATLTDFWHRARVSRPVAERLVMAGGFDSLYGLSAPVPVRRRGRVTRRDLLLQVADLDRWSAPLPGGRRRAVARAGPRAAIAGATAGATAGAEAGAEVGDPAVLAARQSQAGAPVRPPAMQLALDLGPGDGEAGSGLPDMTSSERVRAELEVLGLDASRHLVDFYAPMLAALGTTQARDLLRRRSQAELLVAGVKVATQTPPIRSGRRVVFLTLDDGTGPIDATFFDDAQGPYASTLFHSWLLLVRGVLRRTGPRGVSLRATGCWELSALHPAWLEGGAAAVLPLLVEPEGWGPPPGLPPDPPGTDAGPQPGPAETRAGGMGQRRVLVHPSGFRQSPYADVKPAGDSVKPGAPPRRLWHSSPGSAGG